MPQTDDYATLPYNERVCCNEKHKKKEKRSNWFYGSISSIDLVRTISPFRWGPNDIFWPSSRSPKFKYIQKRGRYEFCWFCNEYMQLKLIKEFAVLLSPQMPICSWFQLKLWRKKVTLIRSWKISLLNIQNSNLTAKFCRSITHELLIENQLWKLCCLACNVY